jgi:hypothetical protein
MALCEAKEHKIWTFIVGVMVIKRIFLFEGSLGSTKNFFKYFF